MPIARRYFVRSDTGRGEMAVDGGVMIKDWVLGRSEVVEVEEAVADKD